MAYHSGAVLPLYFLGHITPALKLYLKITYHVAGVLEMIRDISYHKAAAEAGYHAQVDFITQTAYHNGAGLSVL